MKHGDYETVKSVIQGYLGQDRDLWVHYLSKIMHQRRKLALFIDLIPAEQN